MAETVADRLRLGIIAGDVLPGARMRQEDLAERLDVSRGPIRQALVILEREGLVRADRWRGAVVTPLDVPLIKDLYEFRGAVERYVAETLASRSHFDAASMRDVVTLGKAAAKAGDLNRLMDLDLRFHTRLYDMVGNRVLTDVMGGQWTHTRRVMAATLKESGYSQMAWDEHAAIVDAIEARDVLLAGKRAAAHMAAASARMVETFSHTNSS
jgi:DNA-binding GntR family transcriptional regulator